MRPVGMPREGVLAVSDRHPETTIEQRAAGLQNWLHENAPYIDGEQKHLDEDSSERAYWHYGYLMACRDILKLLKDKV